MYSTPMFGLRPVIKSGLEFSTCSIMWVLKTFGFQGCGCGLFVEGCLCSIYEAHKKKLNFRAFQILSFQT